MQTRESYPHLSPSTNGEEHLCLAQELSLTVMVEVEHCREQASQGMRRARTLELEH